MQMDELGSILDYADTSWQRGVFDEMTRVLATRTELDEITLAQEFSRSLSLSPGAIVHCKREFWAYSQLDGCFRTIQESELRNLLYQLNLAPGHETYHHRFTHTKVKKIVSMAADILNDDAFFDDASIGIATADCFLEVENDKIVRKSLNEKHKARWAMHVRYNPSADTDVAEQILMDLFGGHEEVNAFFELLGIGLFGLGTEFQKAGVFLGDGANGKSSLIDIIHMMIPVKLRSSIPLKSLEKEYLRGDLDGKIVNTCDEFPQLNNTGLQYWKSITSGGEIQGRRVGQPATTIKPIAQFFICTNILPPLAEKNEALRRRLIIFRFDKVIPEDERDIQFAEKFFEKHKEALLILACEGADRALQRGKVLVPQSSKREVDRWLNRSDGIGSFFNECIEQTGNPNDRVNATDMYDACLQYANFNSYPPPTSMRVLATRLQAEGLKKIKSSGMVWIGIRLKPGNWEDQEI